MRLLAVGTLVAIAVVGAALHFFTQDSFVENTQLAFILMGIVFLLILEYLFFLLIVIPRNSNYARYAIHETGVEFYPVTGLGLAAGLRPEEVNIHRFLGITIGPVVDKKDTTYAVYLIHPDKGRSINIESFSDPDQARHYAHRLGKALELDVASNSNLQKKRDFSDAA